MIAAAKNVVELFGEKEWKSEQFNFNLKLKKRKKERLNRFRYYSLIVKRCVFSFFITKDFNFCLIVIISMLVKTSAFIVKPYLILDVCRMC